MTASISVALAQIRRLALLTLLAALALAASVPTARATVLFQENLGNFPDAIGVTAEMGLFTSLSVNGQTYSNVYGIVFHLENTSYCYNGVCGGYEAFMNDPDGDFANNDVLTQHAAEEIADRQPFGIYRFGAVLPKGSGVIGSAPSGFFKNVESKDANNVEVNFEIDLTKSLKGLIWDGDAQLVVPSQFTNPRFGIYDFFMSIPVNPLTGQYYTLQEILDLQAPLPSNHEQGIDIASRMAWAPLPGDDLFGFGTRKGATVLTVGDPFFPNPGERLRPRGQVNPLINDLPLPGTMVLVLGALAGLVGARRRRN